MPAVPSSTSSQSKQAAATTVDLPTPLLSRTLPIPIIHPAETASIEEPLLASDSVIFKSSLLQVTSAEALPATRASPLPGSIQGIEQSNHIIPYFSGPHGSQSQTRGAQSNEEQREHSRDDLVIVPINVRKGVTKIVLLPLSALEPTGSEASVPDDDSNYPSNSPVDEAGTTSGTDNPDGSQGGQSTQPQLQELSPGPASHILAGLSGTDPKNGGPTSTRGGDIREGFKGANMFTSSGVLYLASLEKPTPLTVGSYGAKIVPDGGIILGSHTIRPGQKTTVGGTPVSVGDNQLVIGKLTKVMDAAALTSIDSKSSLNADANAFSGNLTTKTESELNYEIHTPIPKATSKLGGKAKSSQLFELGGLLVTWTKPMYRLSEVSMTNGSQGQRVTLGLVEGNDGPTLTRVVTIPTESASERITKPASNRSEATLLSSSNAALTRNSVGSSRQSRSRISQGPAKQTLLPSSRGAPTSGCTSFVKPRILIAGSAFVFFFVVALATIGSPLWSLI